ncbi:MAG TPA: hypothetical protein ENI37_05930 [Chloroflexi bacterium]|nr:hypothetical protein [Chloroflexota bacterium]
MQTEEWGRRIKEAGLNPVAIPLLETARALGFVAAQALLLGQPFLAGLVDEAALQRATAWLEDPQQIEELLAHLENEKDEQ